VAFTWWSTITDASETGGVGSAVNNALAAQRYAVQTTHVTPGSLEYTYYVPMGSDITQLKRINPPQIDWGYQTLEQKPYEFQAAVDFCAALSDVMPYGIKEIVLKEDLYMQILGYLGRNEETEPGITKSLTYSVNDGNIVLKNEKWQFDLDKYMEFVKESPDDVEKD